MTKKLWVFQIVYYICLPLFYWVFLLLADLIPISGLGGAMLFVYATLFVATPVLVALLMRFSLLKWYVDPIAAMEILLFFYLACIYKEMTRAGDSFWNAMASYNERLSADGAEGWLFLIGLFLFGLIASFSAARKNGTIISYRLLRK